MNLSQEEDVSSKRAGRALPYLSCSGGTWWLFWCWEIMGQRIPWHIWRNWCKDYPTSFSSAKNFMQRTTRLSLVCWLQHRCTAVNHGRCVSSCGKGMLLGVWAKGGAATLELEQCQRVRLSEQGPHSFLSWTASPQPDSWSKAAVHVMEMVKNGKNCGSALWLSEPQSCLSKEGSKALKGGIKSKGTEPYAYCFKCGRSANESDKNITQEGSDVIFCCFQRLLFCYQ